MPSGVFGLASYMPSHLEEPVFFLDTTVSKSYFMIVFPFSCANVGALNLAFAAQLLEARLYGHVLQTKLCEQDGEHEKHNISDDQALGELNDIDVNVEGSAGGGNHNDEPEHCIAALELGVGPAGGANLRQLPGENADDQHSQGGHDQRQVAQNADGETGDNADDGQNIQDAQQDHRGLEPGMEIRQLLRQPAVVAALQNGLCGPGELGIEGGDQGKHGAAYNEEDIQRTGQHLLGYLCQVFTGHLLHGEHTGGNDTHNAVDHGNDQCGHQDDDGDVAGGILGLGGQVGHHGGTAYCKGEEAAGLQETADAARQEAVGEVIRLNVGSTEGGKDTEGHAKQYNDNVLELGHDVNADDVDDKEDGCDDEGDDLLISEAEQGNEVAGEGKGIHRERKIAEGIDYRIDAAHAFAGQHDHHGVFAAADSGGAADQYFRNGIANHHDGGNQKGQRDRTSRERNGRSQKCHDAGADDLTDCGTQKIPEA